MGGSIPPARFSLTFSGDVMIQSYVNAFMAKKEDLRLKFQAKPPSNYKDLVTEVINTVNETEFNSDADIHEISTGGYCGTLVYVIFINYSVYAINISYGSCSGCDSLQAALGYCDQPNLDDLMTLALHIVQSIKEI